MVREVGGGEEGDKGRSTCYLGAIETPGKVKQHYDKYYRLVKVVRM